MLFDFSQLSLHFCCCLSHCNSKTQFISILWILCLWVRVHIWGQRSLAVPQAVLYIFSVLLLHPHAGAELQESLSLLYKPCGEPERASPWVRVQTKAPAQALKCQLGIQLAHLHHQLVFTHRLGSEVTYLCTTHWSVNIPPSVCLSNI